MEPSLNREIDLSRLFEAPHLHLFSMQQTGGASMYANFVKSVYEGFCFASPDTVNLMSCGEHHKAYAAGCYLALPIVGLASIPLDYDGYAGFVDWLMARSRAQPRDQPNGLLPFQGLAFVIYAAERCSVDLSTSDERFRQDFYRGRAITPCDRRRIVDVPLMKPYIQLDFTLGVEMFKTTLVTVEQAHEALTMLRQYSLVPKALQLRTVKWSAEGFEMRIKLKHH